MDKSKIESAIEALWNCCSYNKIIFVTETQLEIDGLIIYLSSDSTSMHGSLKENNELINFEYHDYTWYWYKPEEI